MYEMARFFTVTGDHLQGTPTAIRGRPTALETAYDEYLATDDATGEAATDRGAQQSTLGLDDDRDGRRSHGQ